MDSSILYNCWYSTAILQTESEATGEITGEDIVELTELLKEATPGYQNTSAE